MKMQGPKGATSVSFDGREYKSDKDGVFNVPDRAAIALMSHGLTPTGEASDPEVADELNAIARKHALAKRLDDAKLEQQMAAASVETAKKGGDSDAARAAISKLAAANAELQAATAAVAAAQ